MTPSLIVPPEALAPVTPELLALALVLLALVLLALVLLPAAGFLEELQADTARASAIITESAAASLECFI